MHHQRAVYFVCLGISLTHGASIARADATWINGASNLWSNSANWSPAAVPAPGTVLHIQGSGGTIVQDLGAGYSVGGLTFESAPTDISGDAITLTNAAAVRNSATAAQRISATVNVPTSATIGGPAGNSNDTIRFDDLRGAGNVTVDGGVTIFGATYTGTTTVNSNETLWIGGRQGLDFPPPGQTSGQGDYFVNGRLLGRGTIGLANGAAIHVNSGGLLDAGVGVTIGEDLAELAINGDVVIHAGGLMAFDTSRFGNSYFFDRVDVNGLLDLSAPNDNLFIGNSGQFGMTPATSLVILNYQSRLGEFDLLNNGTNPNYQITYTSPSGSGPGQIIITTPEPTSVACLFACAAFALRRRVRSRDVWFVGHR